MPTLAEITGSKIPMQRIGRELRPVSGVSLKPLLDGQPLLSRPPIHFLFSTDRALRDGDWKLVSFQSKAWELYNISNDRTELNNLADSQPERMQSMIRQWNEMAKDVLVAEPAVYKDVSDAVTPHKHPLWTNFDEEKPVKAPSNSR